jgi:hypothetical protein
LRDWLTRKKKETRRGRAELLLEDRASIWTARQENRQLLSLLQWLQIRWLTSKKTWTPAQRKLMDKASRYHAIRGLVRAILLAVLIAGSLGIRAQVEDQRMSTHAAGLVQSLVNAETTRVPEIVKVLTEYRQWADPLLQEEYNKAGNTSRQGLNVSLALLPVDASQVNYLKKELLNARAGNVEVIRDALFPHKDRLIPELWSIVISPKSGKASQRLRAAAALAKYDPGNPQWSIASVILVTDLVRENSLNLMYWRMAFYPVKESFLSPLSDIYCDRRPERFAERSLATNLLFSYASYRPQLLADLLMNGVHRPNGVTQMCRNWVLAIEVAAPAA